jgi:hypothetical protein
MMYFAIISHSTQPKKKAEKESLQILYDLNNTLIINDTDLRGFVDNVKQQVFEINNRNPRCRFLEVSYREYDNFNHAQLVVGDFAYITIDYIKNQSSIPATEQIVAMIHDQYVVNPSSIKSLFGYSVVAKVEELLGYPVPEPVKELEGWVMYADRKPELGIEVIAQHPSWIDEDYNPRGIRIGFQNTSMDEDGEFVSAVWNNSHDYYMTEQVDLPLKWKEIVL